MQREESDEKSIGSIFRKVRDDTASTKQEQDTTIQRNMQTKVTATTMS